MTVKTRGRLLAFALGAVGYPVLELVWRRRTHWSMAVAGGVSLVLLQELQRRRGRGPLWLLALTGGILITGVELVTGLICNRVFDWKVWDYSSLPLQLWGQICLPFTLLWMGLCRLLQPLLWRLARRRPHFCHPASRRLVRIV